MRGLSPNIAIIILMLIAVAFGGVAWSYISMFSGAQTSKVVVTPPGGSTCGVFQSAKIVLVNAGTDTINITDPPQTEFMKIGNNVPNSGFELDDDGNSKPDNWGEDDTEAETVDVVLVTDVSYSMADCMDSRDIEPDMGTILMYHFDEDGAIDESGWENHGDLKNGVQYLPDGGRVGGGMLFDGSNDYIQLDSNERINGLEDITIEAWIYIKEMHDNMAIVSKHYMEYELDLYDGGSILYFFRGNGGSYRSIKAQYTFHENTWYHVAVTSEGSSYSLYVNGDKVASKTMSLSPPDVNNRELTIGRRSGSSLYFDGIIDEVYIYGRALPENEIKSHARALECADDGRNDMPSWCRYETAHCPNAQNSTAEEKYFVGTPSDFKIVEMAAEYDMQSHTGNCQDYMGCSSSVCEDNTKVYSGTSDSSLYYVSDGCGSDCDIGNIYSGDVVYVPYDESCPADHPYQNGYNYVDCHDYNSTTCGSMPCPTNYYRTGEGITQVIQDNCNGMCDNGPVCMGDSVCVETSSCPSGYTECEDCNSTCRDFETVCCETGRIERECMNHTYTCCTKERKCYETKEDKCIADTDYAHECCDPLVKCSAMGSEHAVDECQPGLLNGKPDPASCQNYDMCVSENGACFICDSVAIRLAKKLGHRFIDNVFAYAPNLARIGLVSYGTTLDSSKELTERGNAGQGHFDLVNDVDSYTYRQGAAGETCISCAVSESISIITNPPDGNMADSLYVVIMSDGEANRCLDGRVDGESGCDASQEAIDIACDYNTNNPDNPIVFYTIGFGKEAGAPTLQGIADCSAEGSYFQGDDPQQLSGIYEDISERIGNAGLDAVNKVYGDYSMNLQADQPLPVATSDVFDIYQSSADRFMLSFYKMLDLKAGVVLNVTIYLYNIAGDPVGRSWKVYDTPVTDTGFSKEEIMIDMPPTARKASVKFEFSGNTGNGGGIIIDDIFLGPQIKCVKEGDGYRCGDIFIIKLSDDGELYPYFKNNPLRPQESTILKDANCRGECSYMIITSSGTINADIKC